MYCYIRATSYIAHCNESARRGAPPPIYVYFSTILASSALSAQGTSEHCHYSLRAYSGPYPFDFVASCHEYTNRTSAVRMRSAEGLALGGRTTDTQVGPDGSAKRRRISSAQTPGSELLNALDGRPLAPADTKAQTNIHTSNRSALLNLSVLKTSLTSGPPAVLDTCQDIAGAAACNQLEAVPAAVQLDNRPPMLACKPAIPTSGTLQLFPEASKPSLHSNRHISSAATHDRAPINGLRGLFESFLRGSKRNSKAASGVKQTATVELAAHSGAATDPVAASKGSETGAPVALSNRAYWSLAALDDTTEGLAAAAMAPAQPTKAAQPQAASSITQQQQMQQMQHHIASSPPKQPAQPYFTSRLQSTRPAAEKADDPELTALLCNSAGLSSGSIHQAIEIDIHSDWVCGTYNAAGTAVAVGRSTMFQDPEALDNSGLDVHLLDATPGVDDVTTEDGLRLGAAGRTPATWAAESSRVASSNTGAPAAASDGLHSAGGVDEGDAVLLLTACMHEGVTEALAVLLHTDGLPFRRPDGSGSLEMLLAYMLVVLHRANMLLKLQVQEPHTLLTMMWMAEAFCSQYRTRLPYVLLDYKFYCKGVTYYDQEVQDVLKADTALCVKIQKEILVASGFRMWVEEPDMDDACQVLRQAGGGAYLVFLESHIADRAVQFDSQLRVLLQQQAAAQRVTNTNSKAKMGTVSPEFGHEDQQSPKAAAATQPSQQVTRGIALRDRSNTLCAGGSTAGASVAAKGGSRQLSKPAAAAAKSTTSTRMGSKQQLIDLTSKEQALGKRTRSSGGNGGQNQPAAAASAVGKAAGIGKNSRQSTGATLSSVWNKLLGGRQARCGRAL